MNHRKLLMKYIEHVARNEGITYLESHHLDKSLFSNEEWDELQDLDAVLLAGFAELSPGNVEEKSNDL